MRTLTNRRHRAAGRRSLVACGLALALGLLAGPQGLAAQEEQARTSGIAPEGANAPTATCPDTVTREAGVWIVGRVADAGSDVALPGATVELTWREGEELRAISTEVGPDGVYRFCNASSGTHLTLRATVADRSGGMQAVDVPEDQPAIRRDLDVLLSGGSQGRVVGRIVDVETGRGVESATVTLEAGGVEAVTSYDGRFSITGVPVGDRELRVEHVAYGEHTATVEVLEDRTADVEIRVAESAVEMDPIDVEVTVEQRYRTLERRGFYERMHWAEAHGGEFLPPELIERRQAGKMSQLLTTIPRVETYRPCPMMSCPVIPRIRGCGQPGEIGSRGQPAIFVDGVRYRMNLGGSMGKGIDELSVGNVRAMEIYRGPSETPARFHDMEHHCAIVIWTKAGPDQG